uniref:non-specific serine/threonine protein kinase n=1 Tax=Manihot esculenta TaxID=3983 RepID=A0A2C9ULT8_MANES
MRLSNKNFSSSLSIFIFSFLLCFSSTTSSGNETDLQALLEFRSKITHDPFMILSSWNVSSHFCQWQGVTCGRRHRRVTVLNLQSLKLAGYISPYIGNLSFLRELNLQNNSFSREIPQEIGYLRRLKELKLSNNSISGRIPTNLSSCSNLIDILLGGNKLERDLQKLSLSNNRLAGTVPESLGQLRNLAFVGFRSNKLSGNIPPSIFNLSSIREIDMGENHFHGNLPSDIGFSLPNIRWFGISYNEFTGKIPSSFSNASNLEVLLLIGNQLAGDVPSLAKLQRLRALSLTSNYLGTGKNDDLNFIYSITNATGLKELTINGNNFGGVIPEIIGNLSTSLTILLLDNNRLIGRIPPGIGNLVGLQDLEMWNNQLSGFIPHTIGKLQNLVVLALNNNTFSGRIPSSIGNLTNLIQLLLEQNNLSGSIPSTLGRCGSLIGMDLSQNNLSGSISTQILSLSSLSIYLDLSLNNLTGELSMEVGNLKGLSEFDVSGNKLSGEIPNSLGSCISLEILHLNDNNFQGSIPSSLSSLKALQVLDLSDNHLSGEIPEFLSHFSLLELLNLSYNNLTGMVPSKGIFKNASATSVEGNNMLCGGIPKFHLPKCRSVRDNKSGSVLKLKLAIAIISGILGVTLVLLFLFLFFKQKKRNEPTPDLSEKKILELSYQNLYNATDGFSSENMIGKGSFGSVYKGTLDERATLIAIKVFDLMRHGAFKSFQAECEALRNIRHRNLVKVLTVCSSVDYQGNDFKALVYEFMINGSLEEWLHLPTAENEADVVAPRNLKILQRLNILIDVAHAIDYLHHHCETQIVHCDLKPSNILLDEEFTGHVGDFGLAKFLLNPTDMDNRANQSSSIGVRGTMGYAPPEYGMGNEISTNGDVYSYGILLLEMFTGKRPTDEKFNKGFNLHGFVKEALPDNVTEILDPMLLKEIEEDGPTIDTAQRRSKTSRNRVVECLISIFHIGVNCSVESPRERTNIVDVAQKLISIRNKLVGAEIHGP